MIQTFETEKKKKKLCFKTDRQWQGQVPQPRWPLLGWWVEEGNNKSEAMRNIDENYWYYMIVMNKWWGCNYSGPNSEEIPTLVGGNKALL